MTTLPPSRLPLTLKRLWLVWLLYRLLVMTAVVLWIVPTANPLGAVLWQLLVLLPAFLLTPYIIRASSPYALIVASLVVMVYWALTSMQFVIKLYEQAPLLVSVCYGLEMLLLTAVFFVLFLTTKKMPAMHKQRRASDER